MTLCGTQCWMAERGKAAIIRKKRTIQQCLITTLSHGGVATIELADLHFSRIKSEAMQARVTASSFRDSSGFYINSHVHFLVLLPQVFYVDLCTFFII